MNALRSEAGFTLLEVVVAISIFALAAGAVYPILGRHSLLIKQTNERSQALVLATEKMREQLLVADWSELSATGKKGTTGKWTWEISGSPVDEEEIPPSSNGYAFHIAVDVAPVGFGNGKAVRLDRIVWVERE